MDCVAPDVDVCTVGSLVDVGGSGAEQWKTSACMFSCSFHFMNDGDSFTGL